MSQVDLEVSELKEVEPQTAIELRNSFMPFFEQADEWTKKAKEIVVTDAGQTEEMALAREARLELKNIRVNVEKTRKQLKEDSLRRGKAIDGMANIIKYLIAPAESHLQEQENFIKIQEQKRKQELAENRAEELSQYEVDTEHYNLGEMSEDGFKQLLESSRIIYENRKETERKAEEERIAREKAEAEERKRIEEENRKLREKEKRQAEKLRKEREEKRRIEAELNAKREAEERAERERLKKEQELRLAPDKKKLESLAVSIVQLQLPEVKSEEAQAILDDTVKLLNKTSNFIKERCAKL